MTTRTTKPTKTVKAPAKKAVAKRKPVKKEVIPINKLTIDIDGVYYTYQPQPDLTPIELSNIVIMFLLLAVDNSDIAGWAKDKNLLRHFRKQ